MDWVRIIGNTKGISAIFSNIPSLEKVRIHELCFKQDGPAVVLRFDLSVFPESPPEKWRKLGYNTVQLTVTLIGVWDIQFGRWTRDNIGDIQLEYVDQYIQISVVDSELKFFCKAEAVDLSDISAYLEER